MKLSEAMLLGSINTTQGFGNRNVSPLSLTPCAIGTALYAVGSKANRLDAYEEMWTHWPWTREKTFTQAEVFEIEPKMCKHFNEQISFTRLVYGLNDSQRWPRPQIAELIATIEPKDDTESTSTHLLEVEEQAQPITA